MGFGATTWVDKVLHTLTGKLVIAVMRGSPPAAANTGVVVATVADSLLTKQFISVVVVILVSVV